LFLSGVSGADVGSLVTEALDENKNPDEILSIIKQNIDSKVDSSFLAPMVAAHVMKLVFADKKGKLNLLEENTKLLTFLKTDESQIDMIVAAHDAWFDAGGDRGLIQNVFAKLLELNIVDKRAFLAWRDDEKSKKARGKKRALIQVNVWLDEIEKTLQTPLKQEENEEEEDEEEEEEEEEVDEYMQNPNR